jgi:predicted MFS family arabinose efflux permease
VLSAADRSIIRPTLASAASTAVVAMPAFLLGAFAPTIREDLDFGATALGAIFSFGFLVSVVVLQFGGLLADTGGPRRGIRIGLFIAGCGAIGIGTLGRTYLLLVAFYGVSRVAEALVQPSGNSLISGLVAAERRGFAMGIKQAAVPLATALSGIAVPLLGGAIGWRGVFALVAVISVPAWYAIPMAPMPRKRNTGMRSQLWHTPHIRLAAMAGGFSAGAMITVAGFLTTAATETAGFSPSRAGLLMTVGGAVMIVSRVSWGIAADRWTFDRFKAVGSVLILGAASFPLFAAGTEPSMIIGTALIFGIGWSFPGIFLLGIIEQHPEAPGVASAIVQTGVAIGALISPFLFGVMVDKWGFGVAWYLPAALSVIGGIFMFATSRSLVKFNQV